MRRLTLGYLTFFGKSQVEVIEAAASAGFRSVGLRIEERRAGDRFPHTVVGDRKRLREIKASLTDLGVSLSNIIGRSLEPDTTDHHLLRLVEAGAELGSSHILVNGHDPDERRMVENLVRLGAHAKSAGIKVGVEFVPFHTIRNLPEALRIVTATGSNNVGLVLDPLHLSRSGGHPRDVASIPPQLIYWGQLCDAPAARPPTLEGCMEESRGGRLFPGEGGLPLREFVDALPPDCEIEVEVASAAHEALSPPERATRIGAALELFMANH